MWKLNEAKNVHNNFHGVRVRGRNKTSLHSFLNKSSYEWPPNKKWSFQRIVNLEYRPTDKGRVFTWSGKSGKVREFVRGSRGKKFYPCNFLTLIKNNMRAEMCAVNFIWQSVVYMMLLFTSSIKIVIVRTHHLF